MAANPPYTLSNKSNQIVFFGINHNDNYVDSFAIKPGEYFSFDTIDKGISDKYYLSDELEADRLKNDLLRQVGKTLTLTDKNGTEISSDKYNTDNPDN